MPAPPFDPRPIVLRGCWDGHVRDTVYFGVTDLDWPRVREGLLAKLAPR
jgi:hypothetical protein